jgi:hypothetical protein
MRKPTWFEIVQLGATVVGVLTALGVAIVDRLP